MLYDMIFKRKSIRKFDKTPFSTTGKEKILSQISAFKPLYPQIPIECSIVEPEDISILLQPVRAPHFLVISTTSEPGAAQNMGFLFQQMSLFLSENGIGSCWVGLAKPKKSLVLPHNFHFVVAFGVPAETLYREKSQFKRKSLSEIADGDDPRLEAARLAPSATNGQPWFFHCENGEIDVYRAKGTILTNAALGDMPKIDIGIALCHLWLASDHLGIPFHFEQKPNPKTQNDYLYEGTVRR